MYPPPNIDHGLNSQNITLTIHVFTYDYTLSHKWNTYIYCITSRHSQNSLFPIDFGTRIITLPVYLVSTSIIIPVWTIRCTSLVIPICTIHNCALPSHLITPIGIVTHCIATNYRSDSFVFEFDAKLAPTHTPIDSLHSVWLIPTLHPSCHSCIFSSHTSYKSPINSVYLLRKVSHQVTCDISALPRSLCAHSQHSLCHSLPNSIVFSWAPTNAFQYRHHIIHNRYTYHQYLHHWLSS